MSRPPRSIPLLLIIGVVSILCCTLTSRGPMQAQPAALIASTSSLEARTLSIVSDPSAHPRLIHWLATPDAAVGVLCTGVLLLFAECNLPGAILPGSLGLLLVLSGIYGLSLLPLRPLAILALFASAILLALSARIPLRGIVAGAGTSGLVYSLWTLIDRGRSVSQVHPPVAICFGLLLGISASLLGRVAVQASRNKALREVQN